MDKIEEKFRLESQQDLNEKLSSSGTIGKLFCSLNVDADNLLGFVLNMEFDEGCIVTNDSWKIKCGGVPKNSFVVIKLKNDVLANAFAKPAVILARVIGSADVPLSNEIKQTLFSIHKVQAVLDPFTNNELQWGALKVAILGTYFDGKEGIQFGSDIDYYMSAHLYEVYVPRPEDLEVLVNAFVDKSGSLEIGHLKYTETQTTPERGKVSIRVSPEDFIAKRTALFGKTRSGKSNTIKVIADMMIKSGKKVGQVIFDLNGEYSGLNEKDGGVSIYTENKERCTRYTLNPRALGGTDEEGKPRILKANFYEQIKLGYGLIKSLWLDENRLDPPGYFTSFMNWEPCNMDEIKTRYPDASDRNRYEKALAMYFAILYNSGFKPGKDLYVNLNVNEEVRKWLATDESIRAGAALKPKASDEDEDEIEDRQKIDVAVEIFKFIYNSPDYKNRSTSGLFRKLNKGKAYFDPIHDSMLKILGEEKNVGCSYIMKFQKYHDPRGGDIVKNIVNDVNNSMTAIIDLSNVSGTVAQNYCELICKEIFAMQVDKFTSKNLKDHSVLFYFEEAHNLFGHDDKDLTDIYHRLAKEGAKNNIGMVYATQSMTTLSRELSKNTENFFIAHLNDDLEIKELTRKYEFKDVGADVQRCRTKGYVRMITLSHRYALPVQIKLFGK